jgi:hypothetical protein
MRLLYVAQENNKGIRHTIANALIICLDDKTMCGNCRQPGVEQD